MGNVTIVFPDELEDRLRQHFYEKHGLKVPRGAISEFVSEAVRKRLDQLETRTE